MATDLTKMVPARLPQSLVELMDKYIAGHKPAVDSRSQLIRIALDKILGPSR